MDTSVAIITASASIVVVGFTYVLNARAKRKDALRQRMVEHYNELLCAISDLAVDGTDKDDAHRRAARAVNTIALVAPQRVISALMVFHSEVKPSNTERSLDSHNQKLKQLLLEIRRSLRLGFKDDPETFVFHLIGSAPSKTPS